MVALDALIRRHRKRARLTQAELAELAGVGKNLVYDLERGKLSVRFDNLLRVLAVLNVRLEVRSPLAGGARGDEPGASADEGGARGDESGARGHGGDAT